MRIYDYIPNADIAGVLKALAQRAYALTSGVFATVAATGDQDCKSTATIQFSIGGIIYLKTATDPIDLSATTAGVAATAGTVQAAGKYAAYLIVLDSSGNFDAIKGADAATAALALAATPAVPTGKCPVCIMLVTNTTNPFIFGTTKASATGVTFTYYNLANINSIGLDSVYLDTVGN